MDLLQNSLPGSTALLTVFQLQPSFKIFRFDCPKGIFSEPTEAVNLPVPLTAFFFQIMLEIWLTDEFNFFTKFQLYVFVVLIEML